MDIKIAGSMNVDWVINILRELNVKVYCKTTETTREEIIDVDIRSAFRGNNLLDTSNAKVVIEEVVKNKCKRVGAEFISIDWERLTFYSMKCTKEYRMEVEVDYLHQLIKDFKIPDAQLYLDRDSAYLYFRD